MLPEWFSHLGLMAWPLLLCSVLAMMVCLERSVFFVREYFYATSRYTELSRYLTQHQYKPKKLRDDIVAIMLNELQTPYYSGIKLLRIIGTISPMLGLLGTVLGIIAAFKIIAAHTGAISPSIIANGLWEAMLTTAFGLSIALPSLVMAHIFRSISQRRLGDFCLRLNKLSMVFELNNTTDISYNAVRKGGDV